MQIAQNTVVSFDYTLTDPQGNTLDTSNGKAPLAYLHGASNIIPGLEAAMLGKSTGDAFVVTVPAADAYGERDEQLIQPVPRQAFPEGAQLEVGQQFQARSPDGQARVVRIVGVEPEQITVDANHPLAGVPLTFDVSIKDVREATEEEIQHGHVHGAFGHAH